MIDVSSVIQSAADIALFESIRSYVSTRIDYFLESSLSNFFTVAGAIGLTLLTIWIMIQGFLIVTGRSQEGIQSFIYKALKAYLIVAIATGVASTSGGLVRGLTDDLNDSIASFVSPDGSSDAAKCLKADTAFLGCKVDRAFTATQAITTFIGGIDTAGDPVLEEKKSRASLFAGTGAAGPGIVAASMLLLYKFGMAMFVAFGPLFILCLLFKPTAPLFQKWLMYGIGLMFANAMLSVVASIALDLVVNVSGALFASNLINTALGQGSQGVMSSATQQLGLGLILSTLIISVPPMASSFFQGMLGQFNQNSAFSGWMSGGAGAAAGMGAAGGRGAVGASGANGQGGVNAQAGSATDAARGVNPSTTAPFQNSRIATGQNSTSFSSDTMKSAGTSALGQSNSSTPLSAQLTPPADSAIPAGTAATTYSSAGSAASDTGSSVANSNVSASSNSASTSSNQTASALPAQALSPSKGGNTDVMKSRV